MKYANVVLVPLTDDELLAIADLTVVIEPSRENDRPKRCWTLSHCVATTSVGRQRGTESSITKEQLGVIRRQIAFALGMEVLG